MTTLETILTERLERLFVAELQYTSDEEPIVSAEGRDGVVPRDSAKGKYHQNSENHPRHEPTGATAHRLSPPCFRVPLFSTESILTEGAHRPGPPEAPRR